MFNTDGDFEQGCTGVCSEEIDNCLSCNLDGTECLSCENGYMPEADGSSCIEYFKHCETSIED